MLRCRYNSSMVAAFAETGPYSVRILPCDCQDGPYKDMKLTPGPRFYDEIPALT